MLKPGSAPRKFFERAVAAFERGTSTQPAALQATLKADPDYFDTTHLLAVVTAVAALTRRLCPFSTGPRGCARATPTYSTTAQRTDRTRALRRGVGHYAKALALAPNHAEALNNRGCALMHMKRYEEALVAHGKALVLDPNNAEIVNNLGRALMGLERNEDAAHCFRG